MELETTHPIKSQKDLLFSSMEDLLIQALMMQMIMKDLSPLDLKLGMICTLLSKCAQKESSEMVMKTNWSLFLELIKLEEPNKNFQDSVADGDHAE